MWCNKLYYSAILTGCSLDHLVFLHTLNLSGNQLTSFKDLTNLSKLPKLKDLSLKVSIANLLFYVYVLFAIRSRYLYDKLCQCLVIIYVLYMYNAYLASAEHYFSKYCISIFNTGQFYFEV